MDVAAEKFETGLEILKRILAATLIFLLTVSIGVFAAIVFEQAPGSVIAAGHVLVFGFLLVGGRTSAMSRDTLVLAGVTGLNCVSILVEPGFVNLTFGVFLLAALALLVTGADGREPLSVVWEALKVYLFAPLSLAWQIAVTWPSHRLAYLFCAQNVLLVFSSVKSNTTGYAPSCRFFKKGSVGWGYTIDVCGPRSDLVWQRYDAQSRWQSWTLRYAMMESD